MKLPGWIVQDPELKWTREGDTVTFTVRIRWWHPGLWIALARDWWSRR